MEGHKNIKTKDGEFLGKIEKHPRLALGVLLASLFTLLPQKTEGQNFKNFKKFKNFETVEVDGLKFKMDPNTNEVANLEALVLYSSYYEKAREEFLKQKEWVLRYLESEKYLNLLAGEFFYNKYFVRDSLYKEKIKTLSLSEVLGTPNLNILTADDWGEIKKLREERLNNVLNGKWMLVRFGEDLGFYVHKNTNVKVEITKWMYDNIGQNIPSNGMVFVVFNSLGYVGLTPTHEILHQSTDADLLILPFTFDLLKSKIEKNNPILTQPTETNVRIVILKTLLSQYGVYDPLKEDFTEELFKKIKNDEKYKPILEYHNVVDLLKEFSEKDLMWLINNIAEGSFFIENPYEENDIQIRMG